MRERVGKRLTGDAAEGLTICTFHALGLRFLQIEHGARRPAPRLLDLRRRRQQRADQGPDAGREERRGGSAAEPDFAREERRPVAGAGAGGSRAATREQEAAKLYARYQARLSTFNAVDFDDLIRLPVQVLEDDAELRRRPGASASATCWWTNARTPTTRSTAC